MTSSSSLLLAVLVAVALSLATGGHAFPSYRDGRTAPSYLNRRAIADPMTAAERRAQMVQIRSDEALEKRQAGAIVPDASHPFQAPGAGDERGPCPGLNTLANHGYLPRNGIAHWQDIIAGTKAGFNMAYDLGAVLAVYGVLSEGDVSTGMLSIGGNLPSSLFVGGKRGLQTHGAFEGDASLARMDEFPSGRNWQFDQSTYDKFKAANQKFGGGNATLESLTEYRYERFMESKATNPQFTFLLPRYLFAPGEAALVLQMFANRNNGGQDYVVSPSDLDSFFIDQRFPPNFVPKLQPYTFPAVATDAVRILLPRFVPPGVNAGVNNFVPASPSFTADSLNPAAYGCALYQSLIAALPSSLLSLPAALSGALSGLADQLHAPFLDSFQCPAAQIS